MGAAALVFLFFTMTPLSAVFAPIGFFVAGVGGLDVIEEDAELVVVVEDADGLSGRVFLAATALR